MTKLKQVTRELEEIKELLARMFAADLTNGRGSYIYNGLEWSEAYRALAAKIYFELDDDE